MALTAPLDRSDGRFDGASPWSGGGRAAPAELTGLLRSVADGDRDAFAELYDATAAHIYGLVHRVLRDATRAQDVTYEAYQEIWRSSTRSDPERCHVLSWMLSLAHRRAVDAVRAANVRDASDTTTHRAAQPHHMRGHISQGTGRSRTVEVTRVSDALARLTTSQRQALELTYFAGHTYIQLSEETGTSPGAAASDLREGLLRLREGLLDPG